ncbi:MAG: hypothetical protein D6788_10070, partial [Planctomycetota bacterium]
RVGMMAACLTAVDPFLVFFSSLLLTETLYVTLLTAVWWGLMLMLRRPQRAVRIAWGVGIAAAVTVYTRESGLVLILAGTAFLILASRFHRRIVAGAVLIVLIVVLSLVPWAWRNARVVGGPVWLTTRAGISLYDGVRPDADGSSDLGAIKQMPAVRELSETEWNRYFLRASLDLLRKDPGRIVRLIPVKLARTWNVVPNVAGYRSVSMMLLSAVWTVPMFGLSLIGVVWCGLRKRNGARTVFFLGFPALIISLLHCVFVGSVRYRLGAMPMLSVLAAVAALRLYDRFVSSGVTAREADLE